MAFEHNPGLAALHAAIGKTAQPPAEPTVEEEAEKKAELEEIVKELSEEPRLSRPLWQGGFGS